MNMEPDELIKKAVEMGAEEGKLISTENVHTATWVRMKCKYGCGGYGERLTCPPYSPPPEKTRKMLDEYRTGVLIHFPSEAEDVKEIMVELEREGFLSGNYKAFALGAGPCYLCDECKLEEGCVHPRRARPAMEACGIDVYKTARDAGFPIEVVESRDCSQDYYGLLLLE